MFGGPSAAISQHKLTGDGVRPRTDRSTDTDRKHKLPDDSRTLRAVTGRTQSDFPGSKARLSPPVVAEFADDLERAIADGINHEAVANGLECRLTVPHGSRSHKRPCLEHKLKEVSSCHRNHSCVHGSNVFSAADQNVRT